MPAKRPLFVLAVSLLAVAACSSDADPTAVESNSTATTSGTTDTTTPATTTPETADTTAPATTPGTAPTTADTPTTSVDAPVGTLEWEPFIFGDEVEVATLEVPIDYSDPTKGTFELYVARHLADPDERIGSLLVNPGGPGFGGSDFAIYADQVYSEELVERFDIVAWDPRGTGLSEPAIDCVDDYDRYFAEPDVTPETEAERQELVALAEEFTNACVENNSEIILHVGTNNSARDMDSIRRALGEDQISYFGFSYGSELGATWATLFPETVRAAVLDGAADPNADTTEHGLQQARGFEASIVRFLEQCSADDDCAFHNDGNAEAAFESLMEQLDENPAPTEPGRPPANLEVMRRAVIQAMYDESMWEDLAEALAAAAEGDGSGLLSLHDDYYVRNPDGTYSNALEAFQAIECADSAERPTVEEEDAVAPEFTEAAPHYAPPGTVGGYFCTFFPESIDPRVEITGAGAGPILVVGTTGDPATPLESSRNMAAALEGGILLVVEADRHTGYGVNDCSTETIDAYLIDLELPENETTC